MDNVLGLRGFEFVELTGPDPSKIEDILRRLGFTAYMKHPTRDVVRWKQGRINILVNREESGNAAEFRSEHGPSACSMGFRVADPERAFAMAIARGAMPADSARIALRGVGGSRLYLVADEMYADWVKIPGADEAEK